MADFDTFTQMLISADVEYEVVTKDNDDFIFDPDFKGKMVRLEAQHHNNVTGYRHFVSDFTFDENGKLTMVGIWE